MAPKATEAVAIQPYGQVRSQQRTEAGLLRPSLKLFENERATYDYTRIRNFSALKYENECNRTMRPRFQFLRTSVRGVLVLPILKTRTLRKLV